MKKKGISMDQIEIITFSYRRRLRGQTLLVSLLPFSLMEEETFEEINYETVPNLIILNLVLRKCYLVIRIIDIRIDI